MVDFDPTLFPQVEALRRLHCSTKRTAQRLRALNIPLSTPNERPELDSQDVTFAPLDLPLPDEILTPLLKLDTSERLRNAIHNCFTNRIAELQLKYTTSYRETCASVMQTARPAANRSLQTAFLNLYRQQCHILVEKQLPYVLKEIAKLERHVPRHDTVKAEFNHEYTPILESYFAYNAYPSLPDRLLLARKSMMTPRQIEVWFQNHRNRAKKDGVTPRRISKSTASTFSFDTLAPHNPRVISPNRSRSATVETELSDDDVSEHREEILFNDYRPPYAFPAPYSTNPGTDPLSPSDLRTTPRYWMRSPAVHAPHPSSLSVDDLADLFAQMHMRAHTRPSRGSKSTANQLKWVSPLLIAPSAAPHPAVVNPRYTSYLPANQTLESCIWQKPSIRTRKRMAYHSYSSYPSWTVPDTSRRRKSLCIPRRTPSSPHNINAFGTSPRTLSSSSSSSASSTESRSTSMSSMSSQTTIELLDTSPENIMSSFPSMADSASQWDLDTSSHSQFLPLSILQDRVFDWTVDLTPPDFVTMDLPAFAFFES